MESIDRRPVTPLLRLCRRLTFQVVIVHDINLFKQFSMSFLDDVDALLRKLANLVDNDASGHRSLNRGCITPLSVALVQLLNLRASHSLATSRRISLRSVLLQYLVSRLILSCLIFALLIWLRSRSCGIQMFISQM